MKQKVKSGIFVFSDIVLISIAFFLAYYIRFDFDIEKMFIRNKNFVEWMPYLLLMSVVLKIALFSAFKLYHSLWRYAGSYELVSVTLASAIANFLLLSYVAFIERLAPRSIFVITFLLDTFFIGGSRMTYRFYRRLIKGKIIKMALKKRVLIIGAGDAGAIIAKEIEVHPELNSIPVAFIDEDKAKIGKKINGIHIYGGLDKIKDVVDKKDINEIIIAIPSAKPSKINEIYSLCASTGCKVKILPSVAQLIDEDVVLQKIKDVDIEDLLGREPVKVDMEQICAYLSDKVVLVTGGGGSIGSELCRQIASFSPSRLIILDNYENNLYEIENELKRKFRSIDLESVIANVRELDRIQEVFSKYRPEIVFHAAAHKHVPFMEAHPEEAIRNNVFGTWNVASCADEYGVERFVLISTDKAVNPTNVMGATKRIAEMIIQAINKKSKTDFMAVRFGNVLGSNGSVIPLFKKQIAEGGPVTVTHKEVTRYFMTIPEAVQLVIQAGAMGKGGEIFVLDMGEPVKIIDLARNLIRLSGFKPDEDIKIEIVGLRPGEKLYEELLMAEEGLKATKNDKIFIAQPVFTDYEMLKRELECLRQNIELMKDKEDIKSSVKVLVPSYKMAASG